MKKVLRFGFVSLFVFALAGCASFMEQAQMALEQSGMITTNSAGEDDEYWLEEPELHDPRAGLSVGPHAHIRGRLEGAFYFNDFADFVFIPPEGWVSTLNTDEQYEQDGVDLVSTSPDGDATVTILFSTIYPGMSDEEYLAERLTVLQEDGFSGQSFGSITLEPYPYYAATFQTDDGHRRVHIRILEDAAITITFDSPEPADLDLFGIWFA
ncbi:MAG: hypothetical protein FWE32_09435 [Oscillospiraceae bacterium]|nr:hypothetical protein [Oscillospiraceae bacterium]